MHSYIDFGKLNTEAMEIDSQYTCFTCLQESKQLININCTDLNGASWKSKLASCIPDIDWNFMCALCQLCIQHLEALDAFRSQCIKSYNDFSRCKICNEEFATINDLNTHLNCHVQKFACQICDLILPSENELKLHKDTHVERDIATAVVSIKGEEHVDDIDVGKAEILFHDVDSSNSCTLTEELTHTEIPITCDICGSSFQHTNDLYNHIHTVHPNQTQYHNQSNVPSRHTNSDLLDKKFCTICGRAFKDDEKLKRHMRMHSNDQQHLCTICGKSFASLQEHMNRHLGVKTKVCTTCGRAFVSLKDLTSHRKIHVEERSHECSTCGKAFKRAGELTRHLSTHTGQKKFACGVCSFSSPRGYLLERHMRRHKGEYKCVHCPEVFETTKLLEVHVMEMHDNTKFACHVCPEVFPNSRALNRHIRLH